MVLHIVDAKWKLIPFPINIYFRGIHRIFGKASEWCEHSSQNIPRSICISKLPWKGRRHRPTKYVQAAMRTTSTVHRWGGANYSFPQVMLMLFSPHPYCGNYIPIPHCTCSPLSIKHLETLKCANKIATLSLKCHRASIKFNKYQLHITNKIILRVFSKFF